MSPDKTMAIIVGNGPKNIPEMASITERESNTRPGIIVQGVNIKTIPINPTMIPVDIFEIIPRGLSFLSQKFSYSMAKDRSTAIF
jgi:hypothetical protein